MDLETSPSYPTEGVSGSMLRRIAEAQFHYVRNRGNKSPDFRMRDCEVSIELWTIKTILYGNSW